MENLLEIETPLVRNKPPEIIASKNSEDIVGKPKWELVSLPAISNIQAFNFDRLGNLGAIVSRSGELIKTVDGGETWRKVENVPLKRDERIIDVAVWFRKELLVTAAHKSSKYAAQYWLNNSSTWYRETTFFMDAASSDGRALINDSEVFIRVIKNKGYLLNGWPEKCKKLLSIERYYDTIVVVGKESFVSYSTDGGDSWNCTVLEGTDKPFLPDFYSIAISENRILIGGDYGTLWSWDSREWTQLFLLEAHVDILSVFIDPITLHEYVLVSGREDQQFILYSKDHGKTWHEENVDNNHKHLRLLKSSGAGLFASSWEGKLFRQSHI